MVGTIGTAIAMRYHSKSELRNVRYSNVQYSAPNEAFLTLFQHLRNPVQLVGQDYYYEKEDLEDYVKWIGIHPDVRKHSSRLDIRSFDVPEHPSKRPDIESDVLWERPVYYPSYQEVRHFTLVVGRVSSRTRVHKGRTLPMTSLLSLNCYGFYVSIQKLFLLTKNSRVKWGSK